MEISYQFNFQRHSGQSEERNRIHRKANRAFRCNTAFASKEGLSKTSFLIMRTFQHSGWHPWLPARKQRVPLSLTVKAWQKTELG